MMRSLKLAVPLEFRRSVKISRAKAFGSLGSSRFSRPTLFDLDLKLSNYLQQEPGVFLEIGANDGYSQSNTYHLERHRGWRGILIEPLPHLFERCRRVRPTAKCFNFACVAPDGPPTVDLVDLDLMSVSGAVALQTRNLVRRERGQCQTLSIRPAQRPYTLCQSMWKALKSRFWQVSTFNGTLPIGCWSRRPSPESVAALLGLNMLPEAQLTIHDYLFRRA
jgi:hypothetical protein